jgi:glutathione S-transferase
MTVTQCGFAPSSGCNEVRLVLLQKGIAFEVRYVGQGDSQTDAVPAVSPPGKFAKPMPTQVATG